MAYKINLALVVHQIIYFISFIIFQCVSNNDAIVDINCRSSANSRQNPEAGIESDTANGLELASVLVPAILAGLILLAGILVAGVFRSQIKAWLYAASTGNPSVTYESTNRAPPPPSLARSAMPTSCLMSTLPTLLATLTLSTPPWPPPLSTPMGSTPPRTGSASRRGTSPPTPPTSVRRSLLQPSPPVECSWS